MVQISLLGVGDSSGPTVFRRTWFSKCFHLPTSWWRSLPRHISPNCAWSTSRHRSAYPAQNWIRYVLREIILVFRLPAKRKKKAPPRVKTINSILLNLFSFPKEWLLALNRMAFGCTTVQIIQFLSIHQPSTIPIHERFSSTEFRLVIV